jgi:hypothetical protein
VQGTSKKSSDCACDSGVILLRRKSSRRLKRKGRRLVAMEKQAELAAIEGRVQFNHQTRPDALYMLETIRKLRVALVKAVIPLHVLNMVYHDKEEFTEETKRAIEEGIAAIDKAIMDTVGITMWHEGEDGKVHGTRGE